MLERVRASFVHVLIVDFEECQSLDESCLVLRVRRSWSALFVARFRLDDDTEEVKQKYRFFRPARLMRLSNVIDGESVD